MLTLREKAVALLRIARSIQHENYWDDVTSEEQGRLEEIVKAIDATANLLMLHVRAGEKPGRRRIIGAKPKTKLRVVR